MTTELNRFTRIKSLLQDTQRIDSHTISLVVAECDMALTAAQPAHTERAAFEAWTATQPHGKYPLRRDQEGQYWADGTEVAWDAWQARASLPTQPAAQATPEPVGEPAPGFIQLAETLRRIQRSARLGRDDQIAMSHAADTLATLQATHPAPGVPEVHGVQWLTVAEHGMPDFDEEVIGGLWYTDPWLKPERATRFMWGLCRVLKDGHRDFKDGKRWQTFGPSHNDITHWARLNMPALAAAQAKGGDHV